MAAAGTSGIRKLERGNDAGIAVSRPAVALDLGNPTWLLRSIGVLRLRRRGWVDGFLLELEENER